MAKTVSFRFKNTPSDQAFANMILESEREKAGYTTIEELEKRIKELEAENTVLYSAILEASTLGQNAALRCTVELQRIARKDAEKAEQ